MSFCCLSVHVAKSSLVQKPLMGHEKIVIIERGGWYSDLRLIFLSAVVMKKRRSTFGTWFVVVFIVLYEGFYQESAMRVVVSWCYEKGTKWVWLGLWAKILIIVALFWWKVLKRKNPSVFMYFEGNVCDNF